MRAILKTDDTRRDTIRSEVKFVFVLGEKLVVTHSMFFFFDLKGVKIKFHEVGETLKGPVCQI